MHSLTSEMLFMLLRPSRFGALSVESWKFFVLLGYCRRLIISWNNLSVFPLINSITIVSTDKIVILILWNSLLLRSKDFCRPGYEMPQNILKLRTDKTSIPQRPTNSTTVGIRLELLKRGQESGYELDTMLDEDAISDAALDGDLKVVKCLRQLGVSWDEVTWCANAADNGDLDVLMYTRE